MIKLSIIIPVYNVEDYLLKCLDSCTNQTVSKDCYEIIVVNDGSTDKSLTILENYDWKSCNHTIINQRNQGLSIARNNGAENAVGDYLWFVDSDDWIELNSIELLLPFLNNFDIICQKAMFRNMGSKEQIIKSNGSFSCGSDYLSHDYIVMAQMYVYKRLYFNSLGFKFRANIYHEDTDFTPRAVYLSDNIVCIHSPLYHYLQREGSIITSFNPQKVYDLILITEELQSFCRDKVRNSDKRGWIGHLMSGPILEALWLSKQTSDVIIKNDVKIFANAKFDNIKALLFSPIISIKLLGFLSVLLMGNLYLAYSCVYRLKYK